MKGCLFHYGQALFRKFVDLNLRTAFQQDETLCVWFRSFASIALLPQKDMIEAIDYLHLNKPLRITRKSNYFLNIMTELMVPIAIFLQLCTIITEISILAL